MKLQLRKSVVFSFFSTLFFSCFTSAGGASPESEARLVSNKPATLSFSVIKTSESAGSLEAMVVDGGGWLTLRKLAHSAVLVQHPDGDLLYDTGIGRQVDQQMEAFNFLDQQLFKIKGLNPARDQLDEYSYDVSRLKAVVVGHMHWDHVSGLEDFLEVPVWVQRASLEEARQGKPPGFVKSQFDDPNIKWVPFEMHAKPFEGFERSFDVFGDGSVVLVDLSGHSVGQVGMFLNLADGQRYFFIGDTTWTLEGVSRGVSRPMFVQWMTGVDKDYDKNQALVKKIHDLSKRKPELVIVPAHDEKVLDSMPVFPQRL